MPRTNSSNSPAPDQDPAYMGIFYNDEYRPLLYGYIAFFKHQQTKPYRSSKPFVIGKYDPSGRLVVYGSVFFLLLEIRRLIDEFLKKNQEWGISRTNVVDDSVLAEMDSQYNSYVMDFVILVSTHARNLFHLVNNKNITEKKIPLLDYEKKQDGEVYLKELFDTLIHNRYYFFDGGVIRDVFSERSRDNSRLDDSRLMGYGIDLQDYVQGISDVVDEVRMKHLTTILRGKMKTLSLDSKRQDVIFLIQNVHSFSELMKAKIPTESYRQILTLMFGTPTSPQTIFFEAPNIQINSNLNQKAFDITVRCGKQKGKLESKMVTVGYEDLFAKVNELFGEDKLA